MDLRCVYLDAQTVVAALSGRRPLFGPRILQLNVCEDCNLDCIMCNRACFGKTGCMSFETAASVLDQLVPLGLQEVFFHGGGEPFLNPRLPDMIAYAHSRYPRLRKAVVTNGTAIDSAAAALLRECRVKVRFSVHAGSDATWRAVHPTLGGDLFPRLRRNLAALAPGRADLTEILFVLFKTNWRSWRAMIDFAQEYAPLSVLLRPMRLYPGTDGLPMNGHLQLDEQEFAALDGELKQFLAVYRGPLTINTAGFEYSQFDRGLGRPSTWDFYRRRSCYIGYVLMVVLTDGTVLPCLEESFDEPLGNANEQPLRDIWWSPSYQRFRDRQRRARRLLRAKTDCLSWCQHLGINRKLNRLSPRTWLPGRMKL